MKVRVYHSYYGCDTGCCGHTVELEDGRERFEFSHPSSQEDLLSYARNIAEEVIKENWPDCLDSIDWDSLTVDDIRTDLC